MHMGFTVLTLEAHILWTILFVLLYYPSNNDKVSTDVCIIYMKHFAVDSVYYFY